MGFFKKDTIQSLDLNGSRAEMQEKPEAKKPETKRAKSFNDMLIEAGMKRTAKEDGWARSFEARKAQGSALLGNLWNRARGWGNRLATGARTGAELAKRGVSGTADALFLDVGDIGSALKHKAGQGLDAAGDALHGALDAGLKRVDSMAEAVGDVAYKGVEAGIKRYQALDRRVVDASARLGARVDDIKARTAVRYQEWQDNRPENRIARLETTVARQKALIGRLVAELARQRNPIAA